jgi:hypothetical protein
MLVEFCGKPPEQITEVELEEYFFHRRNVDKRYIGGAWQPSHRDFYLPVRALSKGFRAPEMTK